jgi:acetolactate synthase-1/2/3 large subunit
VVNVEGDGSALYSLGAWWTQARHGLDVTTVIAANRKYAILDLELVRTGRRADAGGPLTSLSGPEIDFVSLAAGYGVPGVRVDSVSALAHALRQSYGTPGPMVIEAVW